MLTVLRNIYKKLRQGRYLNLPLRKRKTMKWYFSHHHPFLVVEFHHCWCTYVQSCTWYQAKVVGNIEELRDSVQLIVEALDNTDVALFDIREGVVLLGYRSTVYSCRHPRLPPTHGGLYFPRTAEDVNLRVPPLVPYGPGPISLINTSFCVS